MIEQTSGRRDDNVGTAAEEPDLWPEPDASIDGGDFDARMARERLQMLADLRREFARRREDQTACLPARKFGEDVKNRETECRRFPATGRRTREHVSAGESGWYRGDLNRRGLGKAHVRDGTH